MVSSAVSQGEVSEFEPASWPGPFFVEFACFLCASVGFLPLTKDMQVKLTGESDLSIHVNVSVNGYLCLCVSLVTDW